MREIVILSGKGGTGKTMLLASWAVLAKGAVLADCDVDAPNLHLLLEPEVLEKGDFIGSKVARVMAPRCTNCGRCEPLCRFGAIRHVGNPRLRKTTIDERLCEGCGVCFRVCPEKAIRLEERCVGQWFVSRTRFGTMVHALLEPGAENSGKLVAFVKQRARMACEAQGCELVLVDGPPGIGCPAISALSGADLAVLVSEPTQSGSHDFVRAVELAKGFGVRTVMVVNRFDLNEEMTEEIEAKARAHAIDPIGRIPHDYAVIDSMAQGKAVVECSDGHAARAIRRCWERIHQLHEAIEKRTESVARSRGSEYGD